KSRNYLQAFVCLIYQEKYKFHMPELGDLDLTALEATYTPLTDEVTEALNWIAYCGLTNWKTGEAQVVSGRQCDEYTPPTAGDVTYTIYDLRWASDVSQELFLGERSLQYDGRTPEKRHQRLQSRSFIFQIPQQ
ncbi:MAG: hypothetical protein AAGB31_03045, partial [Bdellovibrio sp.]